MGEWKASINYHYSRENIHALNRIAEDSTVDEDDRLLAKQYAENIEKETIDRIDIHRMYQRRDVEKLKQLKENPERDLSDKNKRMIDVYISELEGIKKEDSQEER